MSNISKATIDLAGRLRKETKKPWADIAEMIYELGHTYINSEKKIHNQGLHAAVTSDPDWSFLKTGRMFSDNKKGYIVETMVKHGAPPELMEAVINDLSLL